VHDGGQRMAMREVNGATDTLYYLLGDHLGSTAITACGNTSGCGAVALGGLVAELRYKAWGEQRYASGTTPTTYKYTGQREEAGLGLYFYVSRWYDPAVGRFLQADSIVPGAGNPQAFNRYSYVLNSPLKYIDPTGHRACGDGELDGDCDGNAGEQETGGMGGGGENNDTSNSSQTTTYLPLITSSPYLGSLWTTLPFTTYYIVVGVYFESKSVGIDYYGSLPADSISTLGIDAFGAFLDLIISGNEMFPTSDSGEGPNNVALVVAVDYYDNGGVAIRSVGVGNSTGYRAGVLDISLNYYHSVR